MDVNAMNNSSKIYVAGHRGMVGCSIMRKLQAEGFNNIVTRTHSELDLTRQKECELFFQEEKPEYVFLAAAKVGGILANNTYKAEFIYNNIIIAANIIHSSYKYGVKKLLNLGSSCIYPKLVSQPLKEEYLLTDTLEPTNEPYAIAKIAAIKLCRYYNEQYGTNYISGMPTNLYGSNDNYNLKTSHVLPALMRKFHLAKLLMDNDYEAIRKDFQKNTDILEKELETVNPDDIKRILSELGIAREYVTLWGSGSAYREFLYADDLAEACIFLMKNMNAGEAGEFINIGTGEDVQIKEVAVMIKDIVGFKGEIQWDLTKPDGTPRKLLSVDMINKLGWKAKTGLKDGLEQVYEYYLKSHETRSV